MRIKKLQGEVEKMKGELGKKEKTIAGSVKKIEELKSIEA